MNSVLVRTLHKALNNRPNSITLDERQRAFRNTDECFDNAMLLDLFLKYHRLKLKSLFLLVLDLAKAFDSLIIKNAGSYVCEIIMVNLSVNISNFSSKITMYLLLFG